MIPKQDKDVTKRENGRPVSLMNIDSKIFSKILVNQLQQYGKRITHHDQVGFIPEMPRFLQYLQVNVIHYIKKNE